ncbi:MAG: flavin reductase [Saprospiraceae bacterium]|nr:flavin reductase [Saprospiraceae bacterium]
MIFKENEIDKLDKNYRINLINSITGIKPANLIGTKSNQKEDNLAIFSSIVHLGSSPAQLGMISRPQLPLLKDTYSNILETKYYTINHIARPFIKKAHYTSAKLEKSDSEFDIMNLERENINDFFAPFVKESPVKIGMRYLKSIDLPNGCILIIGEVILIQLEERWLDEQGSLELDHYGAVGISGLSSYYSLEKIATFPYVKLEEIPDFNA